MMLSFWHLRFQRLMASSTDSFSPTFIVDILFIHPPLLRGGTTHSSWFSLDGRLRLPAPSSKKKPTMRLFSWRDNSPVSLDAKYSLCASTRFVKRKQALRSGHLCVPYKKSSILNDTSLNLCRRFDGFGDLCTTGI